MCQFFSFVTELSYPAGPDVLPELTYFCLNREDSHSSIINHYNLREDNIIQWEYVPDNRDVRGGVSSTTTYHLVVDAIRCEQVSPEHLDIIKLDVMNWLSKQDLRSHAIRRNLWIDPYTAEELARLSVNDLHKQRHKRQEVMHEITRRAANDQITNADFLMCCRDLDKDLQAKYIKRLTARQCVQLYEASGKTTKSIIAEERPEIVSFNLVGYLTGECIRDHGESITLSEISRVLREADPTLTRDVAALLICAPQIRHRLRDRHTITETVLRRIDSLTHCRKIRREYNGCMGNGYYAISTTKEAQRVLRRSGVKISATISEVLPDPTIAAAQGTVLQVIDKRPLVHARKTDKLPGWIRVGRHYGQRVPQRSDTRVSSVVFTLADGTNIPLV